MLTLELDEATLTEAVTYDVTRCLVRLTDRNGNELIQGHDAFTVSVEGPIRIIGPDVLSFVGGSTGFWIKTTGAAGPAKVIIHSRRFGKISREIKVGKIHAQAALSGASV